MRKFNAAANAIFATCPIRQSMTPRRTMPPVLYICFLCCCLFVDVELAVRLHERGVCGTNTFRQHLRPLTIVHVVCMMQRYVNWHWHVTQAVPTTSYFTSDRVPRLFHSDQYSHHVQRRCVYCSVHGLVRSHAVGDAAANLTRFSIASCRVNGRRQGSIDAT